MTLPHSLPRRSVLSLAALGTGVGIAGSLGLPGIAHADSGESDDRRSGYGPLVVDPKGLLDLPAGFSYTVPAVSNGVLANGVVVPPTTLTDGGESSPSRYDGSGSFARRGGGAVLVQNHENSNVAVIPVPHRAGLTYDAGTVWGGLAAGFGWLAWPAICCVTTASSLTNSGRSPRSSTATPSPSSRSINLCSTQAPAVSSASICAPSAKTCVFEVIRMVSSCRSIAPKPRAVHPPDKTRSCGLG